MALTFEQLQSAVKNGDHITIDGQDVYDTHICIMGRPNGFGAVHIALWAGDKKYDCYSDDNISSYGRLNATEQMSIESQYAKQAEERAIPYNPYKTTGEMIEAYKKRAAEDVVDRSGLPTEEIVLSSIFTQEEVKEMKRNKESEKENRSALLVETENFVVTFVTDNNHVIAFCEHDRSLISQHHTKEEALLGLVNLYVTSQKDKNI